MKVVVIQKKTLSVKEYLDQIKPNLRDNNLQNSDTWKIQLAIAINFISSKDVDEERVIHSKIDNVEFRLYHNVNQVVNELFESLFSSYQIGLEVSMRETGFISASVEL